MERVTCELSEIKQVTIISVMPSNAKMIKYSSYKPKLFAVKFSLPHVQLANLS